MAYKLESTWEQVNAPTRLLAVYAVALTFMLLVNPRFVRNRSENSIAVDQTELRGYVRPGVIFGHVHMAKTGGTTLNTGLSLRYERICGHKGYSQDAYQTNLRFIGSRFPKQNDSLTKLHPKYSRARVPHEIMDERGYEDCDWISEECTAKFWKKFQTWDVPMELHIPCRDPVDHILSQCNHNGMVYSCDSDIAEQVSNCTVHLGIDVRFTSDLVERHGNIQPKCFDWKAGLDGRYQEYMDTKLQQRRIQEAHPKKRETNKPRPSTECLLQDQDLQEKVKSHMVRTYPYYAFCNSCMGSKDDLFSQSG